MYNIYLGDILCPVAPEKISVDYGSGCEVVSLADGGEIGIPNGNYLRSIEFSLLLPNKNYPFAVYKSGFQNADLYLEKFETAAEQQYLQVQLYHGWPVMSRMSSSYSGEASARRRFSSSAARVTSPLSWKTGWTIKVRPST